MPRNSKGEYTLLTDVTTGPRAGKYYIGPAKLAIIIMGTLIAGLSPAIAMFYTGRDSEQCPDIKPRQYWLPSCGKTPGEAKAAGCIFDPMLNTWTRPECYDEQLTAEFLSLREWKFYKDQNATILLSDEEFSQAGDSWGSWEYHIAHCMFSFRKMHKALLNQGNIEKEVGSEGHTAHCLTVTNVTFHLMEDAQARGEHFSLQDMGTILNTGFSRCIDAVNVLPYDGVVL